MKTNNPREESPRYNTSLFYRSAEMDERALDEENRSVDMSFSSEIALQRWFGIEILSHNSTAIQKGRSKSLLFNHNSDRIVGPVLDERYDAGKGYARASFDETDEGELALKRVKSKSLRGVSVGYGVVKYKKLAEGEKYQLATKEVVGTPDNNPTYIAEKWMPYEISLTPIPADSSVGVGREATRSLDGIVIEEAERKGGRAQQPVAGPDNPNGGEHTMDEREIQKKIDEALHKRDVDNKAQLQRIFDRAAAVGKTDMAIRMHLEGKSDDDITDALIKEVSKERGQPAGDTGGDPDPKTRTIDTIDDETLIRGLTSPSLINL